MQRGRSRSRRRSLSARLSVPPGGGTRDNPEADLRLEVGNRARVWDLLDKHEVDLAIGGRPRADEQFITLATRPNVLVVVAAATANPDGAQFQSDGVTAADLASRSC